MTAAAAPCTHTLLWPGTRHPQPHHITPVHPHPHCALTRTGPPGCRRRPACAARARLSWQRRCSAPRRQRRLQWPWRMRRPTPARRWRRRKVWVTHGGSAA
jgi:hypothetical protein